TQDQVVLRGSAIESRIYAEDPTKNFMPSPGKITAARFPAGPWVREDRSFEVPQDITPFYDGMIAKLVVWGATREQAIARSQRALAEYQIEGVKHNVKFLRWLLDCPAFRGVTHYTTFIEKEFKADMLG